MGKREEGRVPSSHFYHLHATPPFQTATHTRQSTAPPTPYAAGIKVPHPAAADRRRSDLSGEWVEGDRQCRQRFLTLTSFTKPNLNVSPFFHRHTLLFWQPCRLLLWSLPWQSWPVRRASVLLAHWKVSNRDKCFSIFSFSLLSIRSVSPHTFFPILFTSLTGCDARAVHPTPETWEVSINKLFEQMVSITQQTNEMVQNIQTSQFRTELEWVTLKPLCDLWLSPFSRLNAMSYHPLSVRR